MNKFQTWNEQMDTEVDEPQALLADRLATSTAKANAHGRTITAGT
jgi:hypothetical protein